MPQAQDSHHRQARGDERERRALVSTLTRSFGLSPPIAPIGAVVEALAEKGITVDQGWSDTTARADTLATLTSPPLSEILKALMGGTT